MQLRRDGDASRGCAAPLRDLPVLYVDDGDVNGRCVSAAREEGVDDATFHLVGQSYHVNYRRQPLLRHPRRSELAGRRCVQTRAIHRADQTESMTSDTTSHTRASFHLLVDPCRACTCARGRRRDFLQRARSRRADMRIRNIHSRCRCRSASKPFSESAWRRSGTADHSRVKASLSTLSRYERQQCLVVGEWLVAFEYVDSR